MFPASLLVVHDAVRGRQHDEPELPGREQVRDPLLDVIHTHVETRRDNTALVDAPDKVDHNLARAMVVDVLELADVACNEQSHPKANARVRNCTLRASILHFRPGEGRIGTYRETA